MPNKLPTYSILLPHPHPLQAKGGGEMASVRSHPIGDPFQRKCGTHPFLRLFDSTNQLFSETTGFQVPVP